MIHAYASRPHYADHLAPVWDALERPGRLMGTRDVLDHPSMAERGATAVLNALGPPAGGPLIVAGWTDLFRARRLGYGPFVMMQHGAGQSYNGDPRTEGNHHYAGAKDHEDVALFVVPGPDPARRWKERYPDTPVVMTGNMKPLPAKVGPRDRTVAVTCHWPCAVIPEVGTSWREYRDALLPLAERWTLLGHWHPRWGDNLRRWYEAHGIEPVESLDEVARRADVLVADNSSAMFEWAATDRPVVVLNSRRYRREVHHGLRFWDASTVGPQVSHPDALASVVALAYTDPDRQAANRREAVAMVYGPGDAAAAAEAIARVM